MQVPVSDLHCCGDCSFPVLATIVLQEMAARLGIITHQGLGEALRKQFAAPLPRFMTALLVISAITIGNAAFETGNILGASLGLQGLFNNPGLTLPFWVAVTGAMSFILLLIGSYKLLERVLIGLVIVMSLTFLTTAVIIAPQIIPLLKGMFIPTLPDGSVVALNRSHRHNSGAV